MSVHSWLNSIWYDRAAPPWWMVPLSLTYGAVSGSRRFLYVHRLRKASRISCPVVVVGNVSVGGTGKTPLVCWLVAHLTERGYKPGIVTRGYGGSSREVRRITPDDDPLVVGDESILLARRTGAPVAIGRDRPAAAQLLAGDGCNVIVSDDGLQHYALARDCEVVVIDGDRRFGNGWLLPAGPLRETRSRLSVANAIVVNGGRALLEGALSMRLEAKTAVALSGGRILPLKDFAGGQVHAVAGIGNPGRFFQLLESFGLSVVPHAFADHHPFSAQDLDLPGDLPILMTEKDAVRCAAFANDRLACVPVTAQFSLDDAHTLLVGVSARCV